MNNKFVNGIHDLKSQRTSPQGSKKLIHSRLEYLDTNKPI